MIKKFIKSKLEERSTMDGAVLLAAGIAFLIFKPIASLVAYAAIAYGLYTMWRSDS
jgi:hypothetical protein